MTPFDPVALAAALPPGTTVTNDGSTIVIGNLLQTYDDTANWTETNVNGTNVSTPEQALACAYFFAAAQALPDYNPAAPPTWTPGASLPS